MCAIIGWTHGEEQDFILRMDPPIFIINVICVYHIIYIMRTMFSVYALIISKSLSRGGKMLKWLFNRNYRKYSKLNLYHSILCDISQMSIRTSLVEYYSIRKIYITQTHQVPGSRNNYLYYIKPFIDYYCTLIIGYNENWRYPRLVCRVSAITYYIIYIYSYQHLFTEHFFPARAINRCEFTFYCV